MHMFSEHSLLCQNGDFWKNTFKVLYLNQKNQGILKLHFKLWYTCSWCTLVLSCYMHT